MNILHLQLSGNPGGVVTLCRALAQASDQRNIMYFLFSGGTVADAMASEGTPVVVADCGRYRWGGSIRRFLRYCRENRVDVIVNHSNSPVACAHVLAAKWALPQIRLISYLHSDVAGMFRTWKERLVYKPMVRATHRRAAYIVTISEFVRQSAVAVLHSDPAKLRVVYNGMDFRTYSATPRSAPGETLELIYVGRLVPEKGVHHLVGAMALAGEEAKLHLRIVGDGPQRDRLEKLVAQHGLGDRVELLGLRMDIPALLSSADFFIHPAVWNEGFGITLIEAMAAGVPCVAFRRGAMPEIITHGRNGFLVPEISERLLADCLVHCARICRSGEYEAMCSEARCTGRRFDIGRMAAGLEALYTE